MVSFYWQSGGDISWPLASLCFEGVEITSYLYSYSLLLFIVELQDTILLLGVEPVYNRNAPQRDPPDWNICGSYTGKKQTNRITETLAFVEEFVSQFNINPRETATGKTPAPERNDCTSFDANY